MAKGTTSFRLRNRDNTWRAVDMTGSQVTEGVDQHLAVDGRPATYQRADEAADLVARIERAMEDPFVVGEHRLHLGVGIGTAGSPDALTDADLVEADEAMLRHKARHRVPTRSAADRG